MKGYCSINSQKILGDKLDAKRSIDHQKMYTYQVTFVINTNLNISTLMSTIERKSMLVERRDGGRISWLRLGTCRSSDDHGLGPASVGRADHYTTTLTLTVEQLGRCLPVYTAVNFNKNR